MEPKEWGIVPVRLISCNPNKSLMLSDARLAGMVPLRSSSLRTKIAVNDDSELRLGGIVPVS